MVMYYQVNDLTPDCDDEEDEDGITRQLKTFFLNHTEELDLEEFCSPGEIPCVEGTSYCFPMHKACINEITEYGDLGHCRNGAHLANCSDMACPGYFKCDPHSYCIPTHLVCDGRVNCPLGNDEQECEAFVCPAMLRCKESRICISPIYLCDGVAQCQPFMDDERFCDFPTCPQGCICHAGVIDCGLWSDKEMTLISNSIHSLTITGNKEAFTLDLKSHYVYYINLANNALTSLMGVHLENMYNLIYLGLPHNKIVSLQPGFFKQMSNLLELALTGNRIHTLLADTFVGLSSLSFFNLSSLSLHSLHPGFLRLCRIAFLDISNNSIVQFPSELLLSDLYHIQYLYCQSNPINDFDVTALSSLSSLEVFKGDDNFYCCFVSRSAECLPGEDILKPCQYLFYNTQLRITVYSIAFCTLLGNIMSVFWFSVKSPWHSKLLALQALSDLAMGLYLAILIFVDFKYRHHPLFIQREFPSSMFCRLAGFFNTYAIMASPVHTIITLTVKILVVLYPFTFKSHIKFIARVASYLSLVTAIISLVLVSSWVLPGGLPFSLCHLLTMHGSANAKPQTYAYIYGLFTFSVLSITTVINCLVVVAYKTSRAHFSKKMTTVEKQFSSRVLFITLVNFLTWCPQIILIFLEAIGKQTEAYVWIWITVTVLPLNAVVNPMLYVFCSHHFVSFVTSKLDKYIKSRN